MTTQNQLLDRIAELDTQLSCEATLRRWIELLALDRCAAILDAASAADERPVCQALDMLMKRHDLRPRAMI